MDEVLNSSSVQSAQHRTVFLHIPPFRQSIDEPDDWANLAIDKRKPLIEKLFKAGTMVIHFEPRSSREFQSFALNDHSPLQRVIHGLEISFFPSTFVPSQA